MYVLQSFRPGKEGGAGDGNRTYNLLITNQLLCQLSYASTICFETHHLFSTTLVPDDYELDFLFALKYWPTALAYS